MMTLGRIRPKCLRGILALALITCGYTLGQTRSTPVDPGVRGGAAGAGRPLQGLTADETAFFLDGQARFVFAPPGLRCRGQRLEVAELGQERVLVVVTTSGYDPPLFVEVADFAEGQ